MPGRAGQPTHGARPTGRAAVREPRGHAPRHATIQPAPTPRRVEPGLAVVAHHARRRVQTWQTCIEVIATFDGEPIDPRFGCDATTTPSPFRRSASSCGGPPSPRSRPTPPPSSWPLHRSGEDLGALRIFDPGPPRPARHRRRRALVHDRVRARLAAHRLDDAARRPHARPRACSRPWPASRATTSTRAPRRSRARSSTRCGSGPPAVPGLDRGDIYYGSIDATPLFVMLLGELRRWDPADESSSGCCPTPTGRWTGSTTSATATATATSSTSAAASTASPTRAGRTRGTRSATPTAPWPSTDRAVRGAGLRVRRLRRPRPPRPGARRRRDLERYVELARDLRSPVQRGLLARRARHLRPRPRRRQAAGRGGRVQRRPLPLDRDRRPRRAPRSRTGSSSDDMFSGWGVRTLVAINARVQPGRATTTARCGRTTTPSAPPASSATGSSSTPSGSSPPSSTSPPPTTAGCPSCSPASTGATVPVPAAYPTSCSPQAWAAASPLLWLRTLLRLDPWASRKQLSVAPALPAPITRLHVSGINVAGNRVGIQIDGDDIEVTGAPGFELNVTPRPPLSSLLDP